MVVGEVEGVLPRPVIRADLDEARRALRQQDDEGAVRERDRAQECARVEAIADGDAVGDGVRESVGLHAPGRGEHDERADCCSQNSGSSSRPRSSSTTGAASIASERDSSSVAIWRSASSIAFRRPRATRSWSLGRERM